MHRAPRPRKPQPSPFPARTGCARAAGNQQREFSLCVSGEKAATIEGMILAILGIRLLELMFFVGLVGSAVVVVISFIEDGRELFGDE